MAMGAVKGQEATLQVAMVCLDELVPEECCYRKLDRLVDWSFVREAAAPYYADEVGRPLPTTCAARACGAATLH